MTFAQTVATSTVERGTLKVFFLGQAGFVIKTPGNELTAIDPYLSNCCERYFGFKRLMPRILAADELVFDHLLITHAHYDHFDPDSIPALMANGKTRLIGARDILPECERLGLKDNITTLAVGEMARAGDLTVTGMPCDHGDLAPDALGLLIEGEGKRIFLMGDTAYRPDLLENPLLQGLDLLILPINGAFGNLNEREAALVIQKLQPKLSIPCHYWNFAEHGGNPGLFQAAMSEICPNADYYLMYQGEGLTIET